MAGESESALQAKRAGVSCDSDEEQQKFYETFDIFDHNKTTRTT